MGWGGRATPCESEKYMHKCMRMYTHVYAFMPVFMHVCMYACMCGTVVAYAHLHSNTQTLGRKHKLAPAFAPRLAAGCSQLQIPKQLAVLRSLPKCQSLKSLSITICGDHSSKTCPTTSKASICKAISVLGLPKDLAKRFREACNYLSHLVPNLFRGLKIIFKELLYYTIPNGAKKAPFKGRSSNM